MQPVPEELQNGEGFGYVVAFRPLGVTDWIQTVVTSADTPRYVFRNDSIAPFSLYEVKVGVYNNRGEGPFSPVTTVFSAEEGTAGDSSAPTIRRWARALIRGSIATSGVPPPVTEVSRGPQCRTEQQPSPRGVRGPVGGHGRSARNPFVRRPPRVPARARDQHTLTAFFWGKIETFPGKRPSLGFCSCPAAGERDPQCDSAEWTLQACGSAPSSSRWGPPNPTLSRPISASLSRLPQTEMASLENCGSVRESWEATTCGVPW